MPTFNFLTFKKIGPPTALYTIAKILANISLKLVLNMNTFFHWPTSMLLATAASVIIRYENLKLPLA
jgi:hypothetical protein